MALKPFNPKAVCPKCGGAMGRKFVTAQMAAEFRGRGINRYPEAGDQLDRVCVSCGHIGAAEAPLDAGTDARWPDRLAPFNPHATCPKCGGKMGQRYATKWDANRAADMGSPRFVRDTDQLERVCTECEWPGWCEKCLDAK